MRLSLANGGSAVAAVAAVAACDFTRCSLRFDASRRGVTGRLVTARSDRDEMPNRDEMLGPDCWVGRARLVGRENSDVVCEREWESTRACVRACTDACACVSCAFRAREGVRARGTIEHGADARAKLVPNMSVRIACARE